jgi:hypothetical protein
MSMAIDERASRDSRADRLLRRVGVDEPSAARGKARVFRCFLLALVATEFWHRVVRFSGDESDPLTFVLTLCLALAASAAAALVWRDRWARHATVVAAAAVAIDFVFQFPASANHQYLQLVCLALLVLLRDDVDEEAQLLTVALRWLLVAGLFHAALQKFLYGYYFGGEFLAFAASQSRRFAVVLQHVMPAAEFERISRIAIQEGAGAFRIDSVFFVGLSNVAWLAEAVLPAMLLVPATRKLAVWGTLAYFVAIESAAREVFFGGMMAAFALSFGPLEWLRRAQPLGYAGLAVLLATSFGLLPRWFFS